MPRKKYYYCEACQDFSQDPDACEHEREFLFSEKMRRNLSKFLSYIFRHNPNQIGIELDSQGFSIITIEKLIEILRVVRNSPWINRKILEALLLLDSKGRFEIRNDRIRARYGHSLKNITIETVESDLPEILYHGTNQSAYQQIKSEGLKPMGRNLVHLTSSLKDAQIVGRRHKGELIILKVDVKAAVQAGIQIWQAGNTIYVSNYIPSKYLKPEES